MTHLATISSFLVEAHPLWTISIALLGALGLGYKGAPLALWTIFAGVLLFGLGAPLWLWLLCLAPAVVFNVRPLRARLVSARILRLLVKLKFLPVISKTEREALEAGTVWADGELFSGSPDFTRLANEPYPGLTPEEQAFLDGPTEEVCRMTDDWDVAKRRDLPPEVWQYLKDNGFLGMIVPKEYGGLGFSASANSAVVAKLSSRSTTLAITVMVPNSLGPAELLAHYGTEEQKAHYLPRLASGEEMPAFALTEPGAGSDAGSMTSRGEVFKGPDGELYLRLDWNKRYITLASISTVLGLAFKLHDPENLLGQGEHLGITCALIPTDTPGVETGRRHDPLGVPFYNCPTTGERVVVPIDAIIGGPEGAGKGWLMLMECLSAGRGISLPALSTAGVKMAARIAGAYASVRKQFGLSIGKFEGIEEPLARIGGNAYILEAARRYTCGALDGGAKPAVVTAMMKYTFTEACRDSVTDAMDILGGAGISLGPRNMLGRLYQSLPIGITVEGANILTRTLMVFGQGAIRCHPYAYKEMQAAAANDVTAFDAAFWAHVGHVARNGSRSVLLSLTRGRLAKSPVSGPAAPYYRKLAWSSASFALLADFAMAFLGGDLKRKETITGRFSDIFSWMYLGTAVLRRFEAEGRREADLPFFHWSMQHALGRIQAGFDGLFGNFDVPVLGALLRGPVALWSRLNPISTGPSDALGHRVAAALQVPGETRDALTSGIHIPTDEQEALGRLERAFRLCYDAEAVATKIKAAVRAKTLPKKRPAELIDEALKANVITALEAELVTKAEAAREDAIQVDAFTLEEYMRSAVLEDGPEPGRRSPGPTALSSA